MMNHKVTQDQIDATRDSVSLFGRPYPGAYMQETFDGKYAIFLDSKPIGIISRRIDGLQCICDFLQANPDYYKSKPLY